MNLKISAWLGVVGALLSGTFAVGGAEPAPVVLAESPVGVVQLRAGDDGTSRSLHIALLDGKTRRHVRNLEIPAAGAAGDYGNWVFHVGGLQVGASVGRFSPDGRVFALLVWADSTWVEGPGMALNRGPTPEELAASVQRCVTSGAVCVWSVDSGRLLHCVGLPHCGHRLEFMDEGLLVATWGGRDSVGPLLPLPLPLASGQLRERKAKKLAANKMPVDNPAGDRLGAVLRDTMGRLYAAPPETKYERPVTLIDLLTGKPVASFLGRKEVDPAAETPIRAVRLRAGSPCVELSYAKDGSDRHNVLTGTRDESFCPADADWQSWIDDLSGEDAGRAYAAAARFAAGSPAELAELGRRVQPTAELPEGALRRLTADLDAPDFAVREEAAGRFESLGAPAATALREILAGKPSLEIRRRAEAILESVERQPLARTATDRLALRVVTAFALADTDEARRQLRKLANGASWSLTTRHARLALDRLEKENSR